jgi:aryl-alcohol dehydrogenase-like predicted oxidoreductase
LSACRPERLDEVGRVLCKPGVTAPIVGATKLQHVEDALAALELQLFEDEAASLEEPYVPHPVSGHE